MLFSSPTLAGPSKSILIVDDDEMIVELLTMAFEKAGFHEKRHTLELLVTGLKKNINGYLPDLPLKERSMPLIF